MSGGEREKGKRVKEFQSSCKNQQMLSPPPPLSLPRGNRQHVELRISRQLLTGSAWLRTNWNTITAQSHTHRNRYAGTYTQHDIHLCNGSNEANTRCICMTETELIIFHSFPQC